MAQMYKITRGVDKTVPLFEQVTGGTHHTRAAADPLNVKIPFARLDVRKNFFTVRATAPWNRIPNSIKTAKTVSQFKYLYKNHRRMELDMA